MGDPFVKVQEASRCALTVVKGNGERSRPRGNVHVRTGGQRNNYNCRAESTVRALAPETRIIRFSERSLPTVTEGN